MHRNRFHNARRLLRIDGVVNHFRWRFHEGDRDVPLHQQIDRFDVAPGIVGINQELFEPLNLFFELIKSDSDSSVILVRHDQAVTFGEVDLANLETRLHKTSRAQTQ